MKSESFKTGRFWVALLATVVCGGWVQAGEVIPYRYLDGRIGIDFRSNLESNLLNYSEVAGIPDVEQARQPLFTTGAGDERSGMGFSVMESFTDRMTVHSRPGQGTSVTLIKRVR